MQNTNICPKCGKVKRSQYKGHKNDICFSCRDKEKRTYLTGRWSKWGGRIYSMLPSQYDKVDTWNCQSCGMEQGILPKYKYEYPKGEYIDICAICFVEKCLSLFNRLIANPF